MSTLAPAEWRHAERIFAAALDRPRAQRADFLKQVCQGDRRIRDAVLSLLEHSKTDAAADLSRSADGESNVSGITDLPRVIGRYRILGQIGQGGMSSVYLGERSEGQRVTVKMMDKPEDPSQLRRFHQETQILARLEHAHIARFLDSGSTEEGIPFVVLEYVEGAPFTDYCDSCRLNIRQRLKLFLKVCETVQYAHQHLIVHRDLKPQNILANSEGDPKLLDFGIAKLLDPLEGPRTQEMAATQERFLTPNYASPEQLSGSSVLLATDIYSLGVILHELLTGHLPFDFRRHPLNEVLELFAKGPRLPSSIGVDNKEQRECLETEKRISELRGTTSSKLRRLLRGDLDNIILRCLRLEPHQRYDTVAQLAKDIRCYLSGLPVSAGPPNLGYRLGKLIRRHLIIAIVGVLFVVALTGWIVQLAIHSERIARERDLARQAQFEAEQITLFLTDTFRLTDPYQRADLGEPVAGQISVKELLATSVRRVEQNFAGRPRLHARLLDTLGQVYIHQGLTEDGLRLLEQALQKRRQTLDSRDPRICESLNRLIRALIGAGRYGEAAPLLEEVLEQAALSGNELVQAESKSLMSLSLVDKGDYESAIKWLQESIEQRRRFELEDTRFLARDLANLSRVLLLKKELDAAGDAAREAIDILVRITGEEHPEVASAQNHLAWVLANKGQFEAAESLFQKALAVRRSIQGINHPQTLSSWATLGFFYYYKGDFEAAENILRQTLERNLETKGEGHPDVAIDYHDLAMVVWDQGDLDSAEKLLRKAFELGTEVWGVASRHTLSYQHQLGELLLDQGDLEAAEPLIRNALAGRMNLFGQQHRSVGMSLTVLADLLRQKYNLEEARAQAEIAVETLSITLPEGNWRTGIAKSILGEYLFEQQRYAEAESHMQEGLAYIEAGRGPHSRYTHAARRRLKQLHRAWPESNSTSATQKP